MDFMKQHRVTLAVLVVIVALVGVGIVANMSQRSSDDAKKKEAAAEQQRKDEAAKKKAEAKKRAEAKKSEATKDYTYVTAAGDSYTVLARESVQAYAKANDVELSNAQVIAAETTLAQQAGAPELDVNQRVSLKNADVKRAVQQAQQLDAATLAAWETYVPYVVF